MFRLEISTSSARFEDEPGVELSRILRHAAADVEHDIRIVPGHNGPGLDTEWKPEVHIVQDVNGNRVGMWSLTATRPTALHDQGDSTRGLSFRREV